MVGWNEGINTSAPLIYLINQGPLGVPAGEDSVLDVIPVIKLPMEWFSPCRVDGRYT